MAAPSPPYRAPFPSLHYLTSPYKDAVLLPLTAPPLTVPYLMKTLDWSPDFMARCSVRLFEAPRGANSWIPSGIAGEFHMKSLGNGEIHFQLRDALDNQILFEYTVCKPDSFLVLAQRFFIVCLENGSFRGFGFKDNAAACEMKKKIEKSLQPYCIKNSMYETFTKTPAIPYESVPGCLSGMNKCSQDNNSHSFHTTTFSSLPRSGKFHIKWKLTLRGLSSLSLTMKKLWSISHVLGRQDQGMEIGYPTDVKHVAHIGWDVPSIRGPNAIDELKRASDFSSGPLREFGQPRDADWIHDALSASYWTAECISSC